MRTLSKIIVAFILFFFFVDNKRYLFDVGFTLKPFYVFSCLLFFQLLANGAVNGRLRFKRLHGYWGGVLLFFFTFALTSVLLSGTGQIYNIRYFVSMVWLCFAGYLLYSCIDDFSDLQYCLDVFFFSGFLFALLGLFQYINYLLHPALYPLFTVKNGIAFYPSGGAPLARLICISNNANYYAIFMVAVIVLGVATVIFKSKGAGAYYIYILTILIAFINLILTFSRAGFASLILGIFMLLWITKNTGQVSFNAGRRLFFLLFPFMFVFIFTDGMALLARFAGHDFAESRMNVWEKAFSLFENHPFGIGLGGSREALAALPHNAFMEIAVELGVFGLLIVLIIIIVLFFSMLKLIPIVRSSTQEDIKVSYAFLMSLFVIVLGTYFFLNGLLIGQSFWLMLFLSLALTRLIRKEARG